MARSKRKQQHRRNYSDEQFDAAIDRVITGAAMKDVSNDTGIPYKSISKWAAVVRKGGKREPRRPGPSPLLPDDAEANLFEWIVTRQQMRHPAC
jgi:transposase-like protein